jgi:hypothetical protein
MNSFDEFVKNRKDDTLLVGSSALAANGLVSGYAGYFIWTPVKSMDGVPLNNVTFEHYHLNDDYELREIKPRLFLPSSERAIIDCIVWQEENMDEGFLIEALQSYQEEGHKASDLYECADHYLVPHEVIDYWWKEAEEDTEMSMG